MPEPRRRAQVTAAATYAEENLQFIRQAMERGATFSAVPGVGGALMGVVGVTAALIASGQQTSQRWLAVWLAAAVIALAIGLIAMRRKAQRLNSPLVGAVGRRFAVALAAPLLAGAALTYGLWLHGAWSLMPPTWLLLYGAGVLTGGAFSVAPMRLLGGVFMALGLAALFAPVEWGNVMLGLGFGVLQIGFGGYIARYYGG